jgi:hypothetical protein
MDIISGLIVFIVVGILQIVAWKLDPPFLRWLHNAEHLIGAKLMVGFLAGFVVFILFTDRMPSPGQKVPVIIVALLLIWANLFLVKKDSDR